MTKSLPLTNETLNSLQATGTFTIDAKRTLKKNLERGMSDRRSVRDDCNELNAQSLQYNRNVIYSQVRSEIDPVISEAIERDNEMTRANISY